MRARSSVSPGWHATPVVSLGREVENSTIDEWAADVVSAGEERGLPVLPVVTDDAAPADLAGRQDAVATIRISAVGSME